MNQIFKKFYFTLNQYERKNFAYTQFLIIITSLLDLISIAAIGYFVNAVTSNEARDNIEAIFNILGYKNGNTITIAAVFVLILLILTGVVSLASAWATSKFTSTIGTNLGGKLFSKYINSPLEYHLKNDRVELTKKITAEATRVSHAVIAPLMQANSKFFSVLFLATGVILYKPLMGIGAILAFCAVYVGIYLTNKKSLHKYGKLQSELMGERLSIIDDCLTLIKETIFYNKVSMFAKKLESTGGELIEVQTKSGTLATTPRIFVEVFAFSSVLLYIIYELNSSANPPIEIFSSLIFLILVGFKILPNVNQLYANIVTVKSNIYALESIIEDLELNVNSLVCHENNSTNLNKISPKQFINLKNIIYKYPDSSKSVLNKLNLEIPVGSCVGIVGASGSGKSTLINILLGLIEPEEGEFFVDDIKILKCNVKEWRGSIGYVPQSFSLLTGTIIQNILFDYEPNFHNVKNLNMAINSSGLSEFVTNNPKGIDLFVGKNGGNISGGQRQRIAIARAIYQESDVLVFDEATSALDHKTEEIIIEFIREYKRNKTIIIIAHTPNILKECDNIFKMNNGTIYDHHID
jgi:ABC-type multidrug transport system fused ATPase/permease subunit